MSKPSFVTVLAVGTFVLLLAGHVLYVRLNGNIFHNEEFSPSFTDRNGKILNAYLTHDDKYRIYKSVTRYPPEFLDLILLQEDQYFFNHIGINPVSIWKAFLQTYVHKGSRIGGSTITMQVAKMKYKIYTRNIPGKIHQILCALYLEAVFDKQEILDYYLNLAPCGKNLEGFESAAWYYFNKSVNQLNLTEMTTLCVLPQSPKERTPSKTHFPDALQQARLKLFEKWKDEHPEDVSRQIYFEMKPQFFCEMENYAIHFTRMLSCDSETVRTTLDFSLQTKCENFLKNWLNTNARNGVQNGAILLYDWTTMEILAAIGSADFYNDEIEGQVNALTSKRSPGSTLKPFIYAQALDQGIIHSHTMLKDTPVTFNEYAPDNYGSVYKGPVASWFALVDSRNIPAIYLAGKINNPDLYGLLKKSGITGMKNREHYGLSIVLGSCEVSMMELARLYSSIPNEGIQKELKTQIGFEKPKSFERRQNRQLMSKESAYITERMLERNIWPYQSRPKETKDIPIAYKTGTSVGFKDAWTCAIFDRYVIIVWIGNFDGLGNNSFLGRTMAAPLAFKIADSILLENGESNLYRTFPENVKEIDVCSVSGGLCTGECPKTEKCLFIPGVSPITKCKVHRKINIDTVTGYRTDQTPEENPNVISVVREFWPSDILELYSIAGLPRLVPPDYPPEESKENQYGVGFAPQIISPMSGTDYVYRKHDSSKNHLVLKASVDADCDSVIWFCDDSFIARTKPLENYVWSPESGNFMITAIDSKGRSSSINLSVKYED